MPMLSLGQAETVIGAALAEAGRRKFSPLGIAVIDAGGNLVAYRRQDGASPLRYSVAFAKAWTALNLGMPSRAYQAIAEARPHFAASLNAISEGRVAPAAGGVLLIEDGQIIGAAGVSGDTPDNDECAAQWGADALLTDGAASVHALQDGR